MDKIQLMEILHAKVLETLGDQDYYGHPSITPLPPPATRRALADSIISDVEWLLEDLTK